MWWVALRAQIGYDGDDAEMCAAMQHRATSACDRMFEFANDSIVCLSRGWAKQEELLRTLQCQFIRVGAMSCLNAGPDEVVLRTRARDCAHVAKTKCSYSRAAVQSSYNAQTTR